MNNLEPPSLLSLATKSLLRDKDLAIDALKDLPTMLFPHLFLEAFRHQCKEIVKAMVIEWPLPRLPLGCLISIWRPWDSPVKAVLDGIDVLLTQKVWSRRCKLRILDLQDAGEEFWTGWNGFKPNAYSPLNEPVTDECSRKKQVKPCVDILAQFDFFVDGCPDPLSSYLMEWRKSRAAIHLCFVDVTIDSLLSENNLFQYAEPLCINTFSNYKARTSQDLKLLAHMMSEMKNLKRLSLNICLDSPTNPEQLYDLELAFSQLASQFLQLGHLRELYLHYPFILPGFLKQLLRCLVCPLEVFYITDITLPESDLIDLFQCPHITQLKKLCLQGVPLTFTEPLRALLEKNAATLQHLNLVRCDLCDSHFEAMLPVLSSCSRLSSLSLQGNCLSMACLEKLLHCTSGLQSLKEEIYPMPVERIYYYNEYKHTPEELSDMFCSQVQRLVLSNLRHPRTMPVISHPCLGIISIKWD